MLTCRAMPSSSEDEGRKQTRESFSCSVLDCITDNISQVLIAMTEQRTPTRHGGTHLLSLHWDYKGSDQEFKACLDYMVSLKPTQATESHDIALMERRPQAEPKFCACY